MSIFSFSLGSSILKDCLTTKYPTVMISDAANRVHFFPFRSSYLHDGKFFVTLDNRLLLLQFDRNRVKTMANGPPIQLIVYDSGDYQPVDFTALHRLEKFCHQNQINSIDERTGEVIIALSALSKIKTESPQPITVDDVISYLLVDVDKGSDQYRAKRDELIRAYDSLHLPALAGDYHGVSSWLKERIYHSKINLVTVISSLRVDNWKLRKITNPAKTPIKFWLLLMSVLGILGIVAVVAVFLSLPSPDVSQEIIDAINAEVERGADVPTSSFDRLLQLP